MRAAKGRIETVLDFLTEWQATQGGSLGLVLTAGQLADVQELERIYSLVGAERDNGGNAQM